LQIVVNLLGNAIKFTAKGSITIELAVTDQKAFSITVMDTGCGISPQEMPRLFKPFSQVHARLRWSAW
jgi:signal transduction histidine kinase